MFWCCTMFFHDIRRPMDPIRTQVSNGPGTAFVATQFDSQRYGVSLIDLRTGQEQFPLGKEERFRISGYDDKALERISVPVDEDGQPILLLAGPFSFVQRRTWSQFPFRRATLDMKESVGNTYVHSLAAGRLGDKLVAAAGNERGLIAVWDLKTNSLLHRVEAAHADVTSLTFTDWFLSGTLISGGTSHAHIQSKQTQSNRHIRNQQRRAIWRCTASVLLRRWHILRLVGLPGLEPGTKAL